MRKALYKQYNLSELTFTIQVFKEGKTYVAHNPELDVSSCGHTLEEAKNNLKEAMKGFVKSARKMGTLEEILEEAGFSKKSSGWTTPQLVTLDRFTVNCG